MQSLSQLNLLFIDDDADDGDVIKEHLLHINPTINFTQVFDGWDAMMYLQKSVTETLPQLIVLDINMRIINGFEFLKVIKGEERFKNIPVIVYSTSARKEHKNLSLELGAMDFYTKPDTTIGVEDIAKIFVQKLAPSQPISTTEG